MPEQHFIPTKAPKANPSFWSNAKRFNRGKIDDTPGPGYAFTTLHAQSSLCSLVMTGLDCL
jgi:hypothetical protein